MTDITIPTEAVEAAAMQLPGMAGFPHLVEAALRAGLKAWGIVTKGEVEVNANGGLNGYYLPLPTEASDE